ncbi:hypothetical protein [Microvirga rosea]|uniref:hypothetical protein n=1 Tax=Microvirga rosea TaxID=2715425 RepID=UPI001D09E539|nr:hypothetical protein [Microvirga rosea]MCB8820274.1 hypothetical protein [Microvirga rosea]
MNALVIDERFCGPPGTGNGGYVCGRIASLIDAPAAEVTLRRPIPLMRPLPVTIRPDTTLDVHDSETIIAQAKPEHDLEIDLPSPPPYEAALAAMPRYLGLTRHNFPGCFVCGTDRQSSDGLRIFAGPLSGDDHRVAAPWTPNGDLADEKGEVRPEFIWAALDCPGAFALMGRQPRALLLGRMTARLYGPVSAGEPHMVIAWKVAVDGRKEIAGSALFSGSGTLKGAAKAIWFDVSRVAS